jgi:hypothetical protein
MRSFPVTSEDLGGAELDSIYNIPSISDAANPPLANQIAHGVMNFLSGGFDSALRDALLQILDGPVPASRQ